MTDSSEMDKILNEMFAQKLIDTKQKYHLDRENFKSLSVDDKINRLLFLKEYDDFIPYQKRHNMDGYFD